MNKSISITKASGETIPYEPEKLSTSLEKSGANPELVSMIMRNVEDELYDGMPSRKIYQLAFRLLKQSSKPLAAKYKLKRAIMELGPSGYPFEQYFGEILKYQGYKVRVGEIIQGHCVSHEVDVIGTKKKKKIVVECKYHNRPGIKSDVKIPLYINSRFRDIRKAWQKLPQNQNIKIEGWVVTNTQFTKDAVQYAMCAGLRLMGWDFPKKGNLNDFIDISGLYPVTCLTTISKKEKKFLLEKDIVLANGLVDNEEILFEIGIRKSRFRSIMQEVKELCSIC